MAEQAIKNRARRLFELQDIEVKTRSIEEMLSPLIKQVKLIEITIQFHVKFAVSKTRDE